MGVLLLYGDARAGYSHTHTHTGTCVVDMHSRTLLSKLHALCPDATLLSVVTCPLYPWCSRLLTCEADKTIKVWRE